MGTISATGLAVQGVAADGLTHADVHKIRKLLPYQNLFYLRRAINLLEGETADALGAVETRGRQAPGAAVATLPEGPTYS